MNEIVEIKPQPTAPAAILEALALPAVDDIVQALNTYAAGSTDEQLKFHITVVVTFLGLLGLDNPTTKMYIDGLKSYVPKVEKAWDAKKALNALLKAETLDAAALSALAQDERSPADMKAAIVGHTTLMGIKGMDEGVLAFSFKKLRSYAVNTFSGSRQPKEKFKVGYSSSDGKSGTFDNLMAAIKEGAGYSKDKLIGDSNRPETDVLWNKLRPMLLKHDTTSHTDEATGIVHTFAKVVEENSAA